MQGLKLFSEYPAALDEKVRFGPLRGLVLNWIDGDTVDVLVDRGWFDYDFRRVRLLGCNAPERKGLTLAAGNAALDRALELARPGTFVLVSGTGRFDAFGRWLARLATPDGTDVSKALIFEGHAVPFMEE